MSGGERVHVWTIDEIKALPEFGGKHGWFYGLVEDDYVDDAGERADLFVLAEIFPGMGYAVVGRDDLCDGLQWPLVLRDLGFYHPEGSRR